MRGTKKKKRQKERDSVWLTKGQMLLLLTPMAVRKENTNMLRGRGKCPSEESLSGRGLESMKKRSKRRRFRAEKVPPGNMGSTIRENLPEVQKEKETPGRRPNSGEREK